MVEPAKVPTPTDCCGGDGDGDGGPGKSQKTNGKKWFLDISHINSHQYQLLVEI